MNLYLDVRLLYSEAGKSVYRIPKLHGAISIHWKEGVEGQLVINSDIIYRGGPDKCPRVWTSFLMSDTCLILPSDAESASIIVNSHYYDYISTAYQMTGHWHDTDTNLLYSKGSVLNLAQDRSNYMKPLRDSLMFWVTTMGEYIDSSDGEKKKQLGIIREALVKLAD